MSEIGTVSNRTIFERPKSEHVRISDVDCTVLFCLLDGEGLNQISMTSIVFGLESLHLTKTLPVDKNMNVFRVVQRLGSTPDNSEGSRYVWCSRGVSKFHFVAVDDVTKKLRVNAGHSSLDVELTNEP